MTEYNKIVLLVSCHRCYGGQGGYLPYPEISQWAERTIGFLNSTTRGGSFLIILMCLDTVYMKIKKAILKPLYCGKL